MSRWVSVPYFVDRYASLALLAASVAAMWSWGLLAGVGVLAIGAGWLYRDDLQEWGLHRLLWPRVWLGHPLLMLGGLVMLLLLAAAYFPEMMAPHDPEATGPFLLEVNGMTYAAPYPPNPRYPLGSDLEARDLLSRTVFGTRPTLTLVTYVTLMRMAVGIGLGILTALPHGGARQFARTAGAVSAAFPSLLFAFMFIAAIGPGAGLPVFILGLGLTGWAHWTRMIGTEVERIRNQLYFLAAEAVGTPPARKFRRHILPGLLPLILPSAAHELSAAMLLLAELGFIGVFFGEEVVVNFTDLLRQTAFPEAAEWGGMLAGTRAEVFRWYWLPLVPAGAFAFSIMGFQWLASGMQQVLDVNRLATAPGPTWLRRSQVAQVQPGRGIPLHDRAAQSHDVPSTARPRLKERLPPRFRPAVVPLVLLLVIGLGVATTFLTRMHRQSQELQAQEVALAHLLAEAQQALTVNRYETAHAQFQQYLALRPDDPAAQAGLAQAAVGRELVSQLQEARSLAMQGAWTQAMPLLHAIHAARPNYGGVGDLIAQGERSLEIQSWFQTAQQAFAREDWATASILFAQVQAADREFEWQIVRRRLAASYTQEAIRLMEQSGSSSGVWQEAMVLLERALPYRPNDMALREQHSVLQGMLQAQHALWRTDELEVVEALSVVRHDYPDLQDLQAQQWWRQGLEFLRAQARAQRLDLAERFLERLLQSSETPP